MYDCEASCQDSEEETKELESHWGSYLRLCNQDQERQENRIQDQFKCQVSLPSATSQGTSLQKSVSYYSEDECTSSSPKGFANFQAQNKLNYMQQFPSFIADPLTNKNKYFDTETIASSNRYCKGTRVSLFNSLITDNVKSLNSSVQDTSTISPKANILLQSQGTKKATFGVKLLTQKENQECDFSDKDIECSDLEPCAYFNKLRTQQKPIPNIGIIHNYQESQDEQGQYQSVQMYHNDESIQQKQRQGNDNQPKQMEKRVRTKPHHIKQPYRVQPIRQQPIHPKSKSYPPNHEPQRHITSKQQVTPLENNNRKFVENVKRVRKQQPIYSEQHNNRNQNIQNHDYIQADQFVQVKPPTNQTPFENQQYFQAETVKAARHYSYYPDDVHYVGNNQLIPAQCNTLKRVLYPIRKQKNESRRNGDENSSAIDHNSPLDIQYIPSNGIYLKKKSKQFIVPGKNMVSMLKQSRRKQKKFVYSSQDSDFTTAPSSNYWKRKCNFKKDNFCHQKFSSPEDRERRIMKGHTVTEPHVALRPHPKRLMKYRRSYDDSIERRQRKYIIPDQYDLVQKHRKPMSSVYKQNARSNRMYNYQSLESPSENDTLSTHEFYAKQTRKRNAEIMWKKPAKHDLIVDDTLTRYQGRKRNKDKYRRSFDSSSDSTQVSFNPISKYVKAYHVKMPDQIGRQNRRQQRAYSEDIQPMSIKKNNPQLRNEIADVIAKEFYNFLACEDKSLEKRNPQFQKTKKKLRTMFAQHLLDTKRQDDLKAKGGKYYDLSFTYSEDSDSKCHKQLKKLIGFQKSPKRKGQKKKKLQMQKSRSFTSETRQSSSEQQQQHQSISFEINLDTKGLVIGHNGIKKRSPFVSPLKLFKFQQGTMKQPKNNECRKRMTSRYVSPAIKYSSSSNEKLNAVNDNKQKIQKQVRKYIQVERPQEIKQAKGIKIDVETPNKKERRIFIADDQVKKGKKKNVVIKIPLGKK